MYFVASHQFVPVDGIFANHVVEVAQVCFPVGKGWSTVHHPLLAILVLVESIELVVVELVGDERQDLVFLELACLTLLE